MSKLKIAVQKKGRLNEKSLELLRESGLKFSNGAGKLVATAKNFPVELLFLRDDDIPQYVEKGVADIGILGENEVLEKQKSVVVVEKLGFAACRMSLAIPKEVDYPGISFFKNKKIATSYPNILQQFLKEQQIAAQVEEISGSVEIAPSIGLAEAIFDIVSTGSTLISNGLKEVEKILESEAVLIQNANLNKEKAEILKKLLFRIRAVRRSAENKYILLNAPNDSLEKIANILPGMKSPTVMPLAQDGWSSVHSVVKEDKFWEIIDQLKDAGAQGILVVPIEKMIV